MLYLTIDDSKTVKLFFSKKNNVSQNNKAPVVKNPWKVCNNNGKDLDLECY